MELSPVFKTVGFNNETRYWYQKKNIKQVGKLEKELFKDFDFGIS